jgi:hypothetical protein
MGWGPQHPDLRLPRLIPTRLTRLLLALPAAQRARFFQSTLLDAVPVPHRQRFMVRGLLALLVPFLLDADAYVRLSAPRPRTRTPIHIEVHTSARTHTHTHARTHTDTQTHTHKRMRPCFIRLM